MFVVYACVHCEMTSWILGHDKTIADGKRMPSLMATACCVLSDQRPVWAGRVTSGDTGTLAIALLSGREMFLREAANVPRVRLEDLPFEESMVMTGDEVVRRAQRAAGWN